MIVGLVWWNVLIIFSKSKVTGVIGQNRNTNIFHLPKHTALDLPFTFPQLKLLVNEQKALLDTA